MEEELLRLKATQQERSTAAAAAQHDTAASQPGSTAPTVPYDAANTDAAAEPAGTTKVALAAAHEQQRLLRQQLMSLAANNARLAVALAETSLEQQQQQHSADASSAAAAAHAAGSWQEQQQQEQRLQLQLLASQLAVVRDQVAAAAKLSEQQQGRIQDQQRQLLELLSQLAALQQQHAAALAGQCEQQQADKSAVMLAESMAAVRQLAAEREVLLGVGLVDAAAVDELDAKNRGLLQVRKQTNKCACARRVHASNCYVCAGIGRVRVVVHACSGQGVQALLCVAESLAAQQHKTVRVPSHSQLSGLLSGLLSLRGCVTHSWYTL